MHEEDRTDDGLWSPSRRALTGGLVLTITLVAFESLAVATILPDVEDDLGGLGLYGWVFSAFFLGSLVGVVVAGQTTDRRGPATAYLLGLVRYPFAWYVLALGTAELVHGIPAVLLGAGVLEQQAAVAVGVMAAIVGLTIGAVYLLRRTLKAEPATVTATAAQAA